MTGFFRARGLSRGFSLIELMVVVAIMGVLATIAIVSYKKYMRRARLTEGITFLMDVKMKQETYFSTYSQYVTTGAQLTDFYPPSTDFLGAGKEGGMAFWKWDCTAANLQPPFDGFCALGIVPSGEVLEGHAADGWVTHFQYLVQGWSPGGLANPGPPYIFRQGTRWWFALGRTFWDSNATEGVELRISNELITVAEAQFP
ncbi:MAG: prepilin-type N-terminal cleavage/methylation domain-containing protein [Deltaproteobacteria bacterium]|nr:prepilin-type N-terminal cleavage/methylation domain-containing protein [Deltaproteobacteria bacterium]